MRLLSYQSEDGPRVAAVRSRAGQGDQFVDLGHADPTLPCSMRELLTLGETGKARILAAIENGPSTSIPPASLLPPVPVPEKILCVGRNYLEHATETGATPGEEPVIFNKLANALCASGAKTPLPRASNQIDFEAELVVVIGQGGRDIPRDQALAHVGGYTCGNDVSARDWQKGKPGGQWLLGKSFDRFAPLGPTLVTSDEFGDPATGKRIQLRLNGETMQDSTTDLLIFPVDYLVSYLSQVCTLSPGDLIFTGTPSGVGVARSPQVFLQPGDRTEVEIEGLGVLTSSFVAAG